jgi:hypothetical protein
MRHETLLLPQRLRRGGQVYLYQILFKSLKMKLDKEITTTEYRAFAVQDVIEILLKKIAFFLQDKDNFSLIMPSNESQRISMYKSIHRHPQYSPN